MELLIERGHDRKVNLYTHHVLLECIIRQKFDIGNMTVEDAITMLTVPPSPPGWDHHYWGTAVVG